MAAAPTSVEFSSRRLVFEYDVAALSELPERYKAPGSTHQEYVLNLDKLECSCPDFLKRRQSFAENDIRRVCKHQAKAIIKLKKNTQITNNKQIQALIRRAAAIDRGIELYDEFLEISIKEDIKGPTSFYILTPVERDACAHILFFTKRSCQIHGYNIIEKRWGQHQNPFPTGTRRKYNLVEKQVLGIHK